MPKQGCRLIALLCAVACSADSKRVPTVEAPRTCGESRELNGTGVGEFRVGMTVDSVRMKCDIVSDTTLQFGNEGQPERRLAVRVGADTLHATIEDGRVW